jgi:hypothetical protein
MKASQAGGRESARRSRWLRASASALALAASAGAFAGQATGSFLVKVDLLKSPEVVICHTAPTAASCSTTIDPPAKPATKPQTDGQAFRFFIPDGTAIRYGSFDLYAGAGTITSWRVLRLNGWDYLEMTVGW